MYLWYPHLASLLVLTLKLARIISYCAHDNPLVMISHPGMNLLTLLHVHTINIYERM